MLLSCVQHVCWMLTCWLSCVCVCGGSERGSNASSREDVGVVIVVDLPEDAVVFVMARTMVTIQVHDLGARRMHLLWSIIATYDKAIWYDRSTSYCSSPIRQGIRIMLMTIQCGGAGRIDAPGVQSSPEFSPEASAHLSDAPGALAVKCITCKVAAPAPVQPSQTLLPALHASVCAAKCISGKVNIEAQSHGLAVIKQHREFDVSTTQAVRVHLRSSPSSVLLSPE